MALLEIFRTPTDATPAVDSVTTSDSQIQIVAGTLTINYYAVGLTYNSDDDIIGGVLTGSDLYDSANGGLQYQISNINLSAVDFYNALLTGDPLVVNQLIFAGPDTVLGSPGDDYLAGYGGADSISGGAGNDLLDGTDDAAIDTLAGGSGDDTYLVGGSQHASNDVVVEAAGAGIDLVLSLSSYTLLANVEDLLLLGSGDSSGTGNGLDNVIEGNAGSNLLDGMGGNDTLDGGSGGADTLRGGAGDDSYLVRTEGTLVVEVAGGGTDTVYSEISWTLGAEVENLVLVGEAALQGYGNSLDNILTGNDAGNLLDGGSGADTLNGGAGNDLFLVDSPFDVVTDLGGDDTVRASVDGYVLSSPGLENLELSGAAVTGSGNDDANRLTGNALGNVLYGLGGNDTLDGGGGVDTLVGGSGDDTYLVDSGSDLLVELAGGGTDTVFSSTSYVLAAQVENLVLAQSGLTGTGNTLANQITGSAGADTLDGGAGADTLSGGGGADSYFVDNAGDVVIEAELDAHIDTVYSTVSYDLGNAAHVENLVLLGNANIAGTGNAVHNVITGNAGNNLLTSVDGDTLRGGAGQDTLVGSWTSDWLDGGEGADTMAGGYGFDVYVVDNAGDVIQEVYVDNSDRYDLVQAWVSYTLVDYVEWLTLMGDAAIDGTGTAAGGEILTGNDAANRLDSGGGYNDDLFGMGGDDVLSDGGGYARMYGGAGNDTYEVSGPLYWVVEETGEGIDTVRAASDFTLGAHIENLVLVGGVSGIGNGLANLIVGNAWANFLDGKGGADTMQGGYGDDQYYVDDAGDVVIELDGQGYDSIVSMGISVSLVGTSVERLYLGDSSFDDIDGTGNALDNFIRGTNGNNVLDGGSGADEMYGWLGDDTYVVDDAGDQVWEFEGQGNDWVLSKAAAYVLAANVENLRLIESAVSGTGNSLANLIQGNSGHNLLDGAGGDDTLWGGLGDDTLVGGGGNDSLDGDAGSDRAVYAGAKSSYTLVRANGSITVSGAEGTDVLTGIDAIEFADQLLVLNEHLATGIVSIAGLAKEGQTLIASAELSDEDGVGALAYQWFRGTSAIAGATGANYQAAAADVGATLSVRVSFVDGADNTESVWSASTAAVAAGDHVPPTVQSFSPVDEASGVGPDTNVELVFSETVVRGAGTIMLKTAAGAVVESFDAATSSRITISGSTLTLDFTAGLAWDTAYRVEFAAGSVTDLEGNAYAGTSSYNFHTLPEPDTTAPTLTGRNPVDEATKVPVAADLFLSFSENIARGSGAITIRTLAGEVLETFDVASSDRLSVAGNTLSIDPTSNLAWGTGYIVEITAGSIQDMAGNAYAGIDDYNFTTDGLAVSGTAGNDLLQGTLGDDTVSGGTGTDTLIAGLLPSQYQYSAGILSGPEGLDTLLSVEKVRFGEPLGAVTSDLMVDKLVDADGAGPLSSPAKSLLESISDLYVAYFNRAPDVTGLMYWFREVSSGKWRLDEVASSFTDSPEYLLAYPPGTNNVDFVEKIYQNLFDREPDQEGWDYWVGKLAAGVIPRDSFILTVIRGAYAPTGGDADKLLLNHKHQVSLYYSEQLALHPSEPFDPNTELMLNRVSADPATVPQAMEVVDYLMASPVGLTGLSSDPDSWESFWS